MGTRLLACGTFGFLAGVTTASVIPVTLSTIALALLLAGALLFVAVVRHAPAALLIALVLVGAGVGAARLHLADTAPPSDFAAHIGETVIVEGVISAEPDERARTNRLTVAVDRIAPQDTGQAGEAVPETRILVVTDRAVEVSYGDRIRAEGQLDLPEVFETEQNRVFDYPGYLAKDGIFFLLSFAEAEVIKEAPPSLKGALFSIKAFWVEALNRVVPDPHAALIAGMTVGEKRALGDELLELFRITGLIHIVVLSGYNVTIVAEAVRRLLRPLPEHASLGAAALFIVLFVILVGASTTIVRAGAMALIALLARSMRRRYDIFRALAIAGIVMILWNPKILVFDPSFQLSFLATLGLIFVAPIVERWFSFVTESWGLRSIIGATIGTQIAVLPWLLYLIGDFSLVAVPVNLLVLISVPFAMLVGFLAGAFASISSVLALPFTALSYAVTEYQLTVVELFGALPFAAVTVPAFPVWLAGLGYAALGFWVYRTQKRQELPKTLKIGTAL